MPWLLWLSLRNLARQKWLALILPLSISIPLMSYLVLTAARSELSRRYEGLSQAWLVVQQGGSMGEFYGSRLPQATADLLRARGASLVNAEIRTVTGTTPQDMVLLRGVTPNLYALAEPFTLLAGRPLASGDPPRRVMVGQRLAQERGAAPGGSLLIRGRAFEVQAVFATGTYCDYEAWIALADAQELLGWEGEVSIFLVPAGEGLRAGERLPGGVAVAPKGESGTNLVAEFGQFFGFLELIAVILGIAAAVNLGNLLWRMAWQQRRELAILKAVGFTRGALALYLGGQGAAVSLAGYLLGVGEGGLVLAFTRLQTAGIALQPSLEAGTLLACAGYALGVLALSTALPAAWLMRLNLANLLRDE